MLTTAYIALAALGCLYVLGSIVLGHGDFGGHHGSDGHDTTMLSPIALATLFACIGGYGLIARYGLDVSDEKSLALALPAALVSAWALATVGFRLMRSSVGSSAIKNADLEGALGEVTTPIPAGGLGEVSAHVGAQRYTASAREADGQAVARGTAVTVVRMAGSTLVVTVRQGGR
jgi:membrane protein implicated in regulation of membrane protease activity